MNIIIPIAGGNQKDETSEYIKSLHEIRRKTILQYVFESLESIHAAHFIVVVKREDVKNYHLDDIVRLLRPDAEVVIAEGETAGAVCTCMLAVDKIDMDAPLLIVGSNQILTIPAQDILQDFQQKDYDGGVVVFDDVHPRWSFVKLDESNMVIEAAEKRPISRNAVAGFYYFKEAKSFIESAQQMIKKNANVNGKYYICPSYNEMILKQKKIGSYRIEKSQYFNFNSTAGIEAYEAHLAKGE